MSQPSGKDRPKCNDYICAYSCIQEFSNGETEIQQFETNYDYEIHLNNLMHDSSVEDSLHKVESRLLSVTSLHMALESCDPIARRSQFEFSSNYTWVHNSITIGPDQAAVAYLGSAPSDKIDTVKGETRIAPNCMHSWSYPYTINLTFFISL